MGVLNNYRYVTVNALSNLKLSAPVKISWNKDTFSTPISVPCTIGYYYVCAAELSSSQTGSIYVVSGGTLIAEGGTGYRRFAIFKAEATTVKVHSTNAYGFWEFMCSRIY